MIKYIISILLTYYILPSGDNVPEPANYFCYFSDRIAKVETGRNHYQNGSVITNSKGCIGENQIKPETAEMINHIYDVSLDPTILEDNRKIKDLYLKWMLSTGMQWPEVINGYNMGHNSQWWNTNYCTQVLGNDIYLENKLIMRVKQEYYVELIDNKVK